MAKSAERSRGGERLFISLDPPEEVRRTTALWGREALAGIEGGRAVGHDSVHMTLAFLGTLSARERDGVAEAIAALTTPRAALKTAGPLVLPRRSPRAIAIEVADQGESLARIRSELLGLLKGSIGWQPERSTFLPHMTAVRLGRGAKLRNPDLPPTPALEFEAGEIVLYRSILDPAGAIYDPLVRIELDREDGP